MNMIKHSVLTVWIVITIVGTVCASSIAEVFTKEPTGIKENLERPPEIFSKDTVSSSRRARGVALRGNDVRWANGIIPYQFEPGYTSEMQDAIVLRMRKLETLVSINNARCIQFRSKVPADVYYIKIQNGDGCSSTIGQGVGQVTLQPGGCIDDGPVFHEFMHVLGFFHEHQRSDRDSYVKIYDQNVKSAAISNFVMANNVVADMLNTSYDYSSVMHYGRTDFSKNGLPTMEPIQANVKIGQNYNLSNGDIALIRQFYNCSSAGPALPPFTIPVEPAYPGQLTSTYSSEFTNKSSMFVRNGSFSGKFYYEVLNITLPFTPGRSYYFQCKSNIDTFAYLYNRTFDPLNPSANLLNAFDDENYERWEFSFGLTYPPPETILLVVTTYNPYVTGPFLVVGNGQKKAIFNRLDSVVQPTTTTTTTIKTTSTTAKTTTTTTNNLFNVGRWSTTGSLAIGRIHHTSTLLPDGRVITIGGNEGGSSMELYSPTTRTWSRGVSMFNARQSHTATLLPDGRVFVTGGWYYNTATKTAEIYDPVRNTWTAVGNMNFGRYGHAAVYLPAPINKILVMGGYGDSTAPLPLQSCELYDFTSNKWTNTTSMLSKRVYLTATYLQSMNIVVAIGDGFQESSAEIFNVLTLQWTRSLNSMPDYRTGHTATLLPNGQIFIAGGSYSISTTYLYNPTTKSFTLAANTTQARIEPSTTLLPSGLVLLTGGMQSSGSMLRSAEVYDYRLNTWRSVADMNTGRFRHTSIVIDSSSSSPTVLAIGGQKDWSTSPSVTVCELFSING